MSEIYFILE